MERAVTIDPAPFRSSSAPTTPRELSNCNVSKFGWSGPLQQCDTKTANVISLVQYISLNARKLVPAIECTLETAACCRALLDGHGDSLIHGSKEPAKSAQTDP